MWRHNVRDLEAALPGGAKGLGALTFRCTTELFALPAIVASRGVRVPINSNPTPEMARDAATKKLPRLNWRDRLPSWLPGSHPKTGSEIVNEPVVGLTGCESNKPDEPEPVVSKTGSMHATEPVSLECLRAWLEACSPQIHAQRLLAWLQAEGHGGWNLSRVSVRDGAYPEMCAKRDWDPLPWHGPMAVGKYLAELCGGRPIRAGPDGKPTRCYAIPGAVVELAERQRAS